MEKLELDQEGLHRYQFFYMELERIQAGHCLTSNPPQLMLPIRALAIVSSKSLSCVPISHIELAPGFSLSKDD